MTESRSDLHEPAAAPLFAPGVDEFFAVLDAQLATIRKLAEPLGTRLPRVRDKKTAREIALGVHVLLVHLVKGHGAIELAIAQCLATLSDGLRVMSLGYSSAEDYAREAHGINASSAAKMIRLWRKLRDFHFAREAVRQGKLTVRKAEVIAPHLTKKNEAELVLLAMESTVRGLRAKLKEPRDPDAAPWLRFRCEVAPEYQPLLRTAMALAGWVLDNPRATPHQRLEAIVQEYLGSHVAPPDDCVDKVHFTPTDEREAAEEHAEKQHGQWKDLPVAPLGPAPPETGETDPFRIDAFLRYAMQKRRTWDEVLGQIVLLFKSAAAWEELGFTSFRQYCAEALGVGERTLAQRAALERGLLKNPLLRKALQENRLSYEKARLIARDAEPGQIPEWIEKGQSMTCIGLRDALQQSREAQMCAQGMFGLTMPPGIVEQLTGAFRALRAAAKRWMSVSDCLVGLAAHFFETYEYLLSEAKTLQHRIRARDGHLCQVPGCSRAATHAHHIIPRARGGPDEDWNLISLCTAHHLFGIHSGKLEVSGRAPDKLVWKFRTRRNYAQTAVG